MTSPTGESGPAGSQDLETFTMEGCTDPELYDNLTRTRPSIAGRAASLGVEVVETAKVTLVSPVVIDGEPSDAVAAQKDLPPGGPPDNSGCLIPALVVSGTAAAVLAVAVVLGTTGKSPDTTTTQPTPNNTTQTVQYDELCKKTESTVQPLSERTPSISPEQLGLLEEKIWEAETVQEVEQVLNDVTAQWRTEVHLGSIPREVDGFKLDDDTSSLDDRVIKISAMHYLEAVAEVPEKLLHSSNVYLTTGIKMNGDPIQQYYFENTDGEPTFIIGIGPSERTKDITTDLHGWDIVLSTCRTTKDREDKEFTALNQGISYGDEDTEPPVGVFLYEAVPQRLEDDKHQLVVQMLQDPTWFEENFAGYHINSKKDLLLQEIAAVNPEGATQLASNLPQTGH